MRSMWASFVFGALLLLVSLCCWCEKGAIPPVAFCGGLGAGFVASGVLMFVEGV